MMSGNPLDKGISKTDTTSSSTKRGLSIKLINIKQTTIENNNVRP